MYTWQENKGDVRCVVRFDWNKGAIQQVCRKAAMMMKKMTRRRRGRARRQKEGRCMWSRCFRRINTKNNSTVIVIQGLNFHIHPNINNFTWLLCIAAVNNLNKQKIYRKVWTNFVQLPDRNFRLCNCRKVTWILQQEESYEMCVVSLCNWYSMCVCVTWVWFSWSLGDHFLVPFVV